MSNQLATKETLAWRLEEAKVLWQQGETDKAISVVKSLNRALKVLKKNHALFVLYLMRLNRIAHLLAMPIVSFMLTQFVVQVNGLHRLVQKARTQSSRST